MKLFIQTCALILSQLLLCPSASHAAASWVDTNFVSSPTRMGQSEAPNEIGSIDSIAPMADGKIYVGGSFTNLQGKTRWGLARLHPNGLLDESFDPTFLLNKTNLTVALLAEPMGSVLAYVRYRNGASTNLFIRIAPSGEPSYFLNPSNFVPVAVQPDGNLIVYRNMFPTGGSLTVARLGANLELDEGFIRTDFGSLFVNTPLVAGIQKDAKILIWFPSSSVFQAGTTLPYQLPRITRLFPDGRLDPSLETSALGLLSTAYTGVILPDGKILSRADTSAPIRPVTGFFLTTDSGLVIPGFGSSVPISPAQPGPAILLGSDGFLYDRGARTMTRYTPEGVLDPSFSMTVAATNLLLNPPSIQSAKAMPDGSILVSGRFNTVDNMPFSGLVRLRDPNQQSSNAAIEFITFTNYFSESTNTYPIILKRTGDPNISVSATVTRIGGSAGPNDFQFQNSVTFQPGEMTNGISILFPYDGIAGNERDVVLSLETPTPGAMVGVRSNQFIKLLDREIDFRTAPGSELKVIEGYALNLRSLLNPTGTINTALKVTASISGIGYAVTNDFPTTNAQGTLYQSSDFFSSGNLDNRGADGDRTVRLDLSFSNSISEPDLRLQTTNLTVFLRVQDDDSPAGPGAGLTNQTIRAFTSPTGNSISLAGSTELSILGSDLVQGSSIAATGSQSIASLVALSNGNILVGGSFSNLFGSANRNLLRMTKELMVDPTFAIGTGPDGSISKVFSYPDGRVLVSGTFTNFSGLPLSTVARLGANGALDTTLNISNLVASRLESAWLLADESVLVRLSNKNLRRINPDDTLAQNFSGSTEFSLSDARLTADGKILVAQSTGSINGVYVTNLMRLTATGQRDPSFNPRMGPNDSVYAAYPLPDGRSLVGGTFTSFNGASCRYLALLNIDGSLNKPLPLENPNSTSTRSIEGLPDGSVLIGGNFSSLLGVPRRNVARITADGTLLPQTPALLSEPIAAGQRVHIRTEPGMTFHLQSSSNLVHWNTTTSFTATAYSTAITNLPAAPGESRFLRTIANP